MLPTKLYISKSNSNNFKFIFFKKEITNITDLDIKFE